MPIGCLAWDATERTFFAASSPSPAHDKGKEKAEGTVYQVNLFRQREDKGIEAVGGLGVADTLRIGEPDSHAKRERSIAVE
jgi:pre-rRNA-processing protein IPI3